MKFSVGCVNLVAKLLCEISIVIIFFKYSEERVYPTGSYENCRTGKLVFSDEYLMLRVKLISSLARFSKINFVMQIRNSIPSLEVEPGVLEYKSRALRKRQSLCRSSKPCWFHTLKRTNNHNLKILFFFKLKIRIKK